MPWSEPSKTYLCDNSTVRRATVQLNVRKRQGWGSTITRHERRLITARHVVEGINPLPSEGPTPWPNDPAYDWQLGDPLPNYPGAVYHPDRRLRTTGHYPNMRMLPAGSASYLYINRLSRDCVYAEIHEPVNGAQRRILSRQIRASCRLARALGAVAIVDPKFRPTWSAWPRSPGDPPSLAAWKVELRRAQGYAVASHHQQRNPISAHVKREARAHFEAAGRICGLCLRPVEVSHPIHFDHIEPWWAGGDDSAANLRLVHADCNRHRPSGAGGFGGSGLRGILEIDGPVGPSRARSVELDPLISRILRDGPRPPRAVRKLAIAADYVESEVRRAKVRLGIHSVRTDQARADGWAWELEPKIQGDGH